MHASHPSKGIGRLNPNLRTSRKSSIVCNESPVPPCFQPFPFCAPVFPSSFSYTKPTSSLQIHYYPQRPPLQFLTSALDVGLKPSTYNDQYRNDTAGARSKAKAERSLRTMPSAAAYSSPSVLRTPLIAKAPKSSTQVPDHPSKIASPSALSPSLREPFASDEDGLLVYASEWPLVPAPNPTPAPPVSPWALVKKKTRKLTDELVGMWHCFPCWDYWYFCTR